MTTADDVSMIEQTLRINAGVLPEERAELIEQWTSLDHRLRSFDPSAVELQLTVKERDTPSQKATLEAWIAGFPHLVATSHRPDYTAAMNELRDDMIRLISTTKQKTEPRNNKHLRDDIRH